MRIESLLHALLNPPSGCGLMTGMYIKADEHVIIGIVYGGLMAAAPFKPLRLIPATRISVT